MLSHQSAPQPPGRGGPERLPIKRLFAGLAVIVATPVVFVVLMTGRGTEAPPRAAMSPSELPPPPNTSPRRVPPEAVAPAPPKRQPRARPPAEPNIPSTPAPPSVWSARLLSSGASVISPWAALGGPDSVDAAPVLPAPVGQRYVVLRIEVESSAESGAVFSITDDGCGAATARLLVDEMPVSPVGCVSSPPNIFEPFAGGRLALEPARPTAVVTLAFVVAEAVSAAAWTLDGRLVDRLLLPPVSLVEPERIEGAWHKLPGQRLGRRYADDLLDAICPGGHGAVFVRRISPTTWMFDFPFTDLVSSPGTVSDSGTMVEATLELSGIERRLRARPIQAGDLLVLYLGDAPAERVAYRRAGR